MDVEDMSFAEVILLLALLVIDKYSPKRILPNSYVPERRNVIKGNLGFLRFELRVDSLTKE